MNPARLPKTFDETLRPALLIGCGGAALLLIGGLFDVGHSLRGYLIGWFFCLSATMGAMAMLMMHHLTGGRWGWALRRPVEAAIATLPYLALGFIPIALGARSLFPWADPSRVADEPILQHRHLLFGVPLVLGRAAVFLLLWMLMGWLLRRWSLLHDRGGNVRYLRRLARLSGIGLVLYFITMSLASVDWISSREVDWYSSTFGFVTVTGQSVSGLAVLIIALSLLHQSVLRPLITERAVHDLGNLLQTVVVLWAYVSFFQYLVIWVGNSQEDLLWFHHRTQGGWKWVGQALIVMNFGLPFVLLLFKRIKKDVRLLACVALGLLVMRLIDIIWMVSPSSSSEVARGLHWLDLVGPCAMFGLWWACFVWQLRSLPLVPLARREEISENSETVTHVANGVQS